MFAFARSFFKICTADKFNVADLELSKYKVNTEPPPLLDNLIEPNILEVAPGKNKIIIIGILANLSKIIYLSLSLKSHLE